MKSHLLYSIKFLQAVDRGDSPPKLFKTQKEAHGLSVTVMAICWRFALCGCRAPIGGSGQSESIELGKACTRIIHRDRLFHGRC